MKKQIMRVLWGGLGLLCGWGLCQSAVAGELHLFVGAGLRQKVINSMQGSESLSIGDTKFDEAVFVEGDPAVMLALGGFLFGWAKPVPVDTRRLNDPRNDHPKVAAALLKQGAHMLQLGVDRIGTDDSFFELGGTSLDAARFVNGLQAELNVPLPVTTW